MWHISNCRIADIYDRNVATQKFQRSIHGFMKCGIDDQQPAITIVQNISDRFRFNSCVQRIENTACHGNAEMRLEHFGGICSNHRYGITKTKPHIDERGRQRAATAIGFRPAIAAFTINQRCAFTKKVSCALDKT